MTLALLALVAVAALVIAVGWIVWLKRTTEAGVRARYGARLVLLEGAANCFGLKSRGAAQIRGNGCLAASDEEVCFVMWAPRRELIIRRDQIRSVETPRSHLGKSHGVQLLAITHGDGDRTDSVAWHVRDLDSWVKELSRV